MKRTCIGLLSLSLLTPGLAGAYDTATCGGKRDWQRGVVRDAIWRWFENDAQPSDLIELVQAEHGIVACARGALPGRLHTPDLPRGLELDQLGAVLLANELEWSGLIPPPEEGLAGEFFRVRLAPRAVSHARAAGLRHTHIHVRVDR